jgi:predicted HicB family RNase H-like nuclease
MTKKEYDALTERLNAASGEDTEKKRLMLYLEPSLHARLKTLCKVRRVSMNTFGTLAIEDAISHFEQSTDRKDAP